ncbi:MAG: glycosyltransferase family 2 protein [Rickettsiales bacterium]
MNASAESPLLSIIVPMKNESDGLDALFARLRPCLEQITPYYEIICIDDGSSDDTYVRLAAYHQQDSRIRALKLSRNFGKEAAMAAALSHARGKAVVPIDADLQDPPELIAEMVRAWEQGAKVVLATRRSRPGDSWLKRHSAEWFYRLINKFSTISIPENTGDFRLMDQQVVQAVNQMQERTRFAKGLFAWVGFPTTTIHFDREDRAVGTTKWNYWKLWSYALDGILAFSTVPLKIWTYIGAIISLLSFLFALIIVIRTLILGNDVPGYSSLMVTVLFMGGIQLMSLGIIGEYVGRIYRETKRRPLYIIEESVGL